MTDDPLYIAIDLDGTLAQYDGWKGLDHIGDPKPGGKEFLEILKKNIFIQRPVEIIIYTCRAERGLHYVEDWLRTHGIPFDHINHNPDQPKTAGSKKIWSHYYIDDRNAGVESLKRSVQEIIVKESDLIYRHLED